VASVGHLFSQPAGWQGLLAALLAPLPWCLALCLRRRRRAGELDLPALLGTHMLGCLLLAGASLLRLLWPAERRPFLRFEAVVLTAGLLLLGLVVRRRTDPGRRAFLARAALAYGLLLAVLCGFGLLAVSFGQDLTYDLINYHYYNGYAFLHNRWEMDIQPAGQETYLNPLLDLPLYLVIHRVPPIWVGFLLGAVHGCAIVLVFLIAHRLVSLSAGLRRYRLVLAGLCAAGGIREPVFLGTLGTAFNDTVLGCVVLAALYLLVPSRADGVAWPRRGLLAGVALLLGAATGCKLAHATFGVGLLVAVLVAVPTGRRKLAVGGTWAAGLAAGFLLTNGWWMLRLWQKFHNPIFPYYNNVFRSPYWFHSAIPSGRTYPENWIERIFYPFYFLPLQTRIMEAPFRDAGPSVVYVLLVVAAGVFLVRAARRCSLEKGLFDPPLGRCFGFVLVFVVASYVIWQVQFCVYRYLAPVNLLSPLVIVLLCAYLLRRPAAVLAAAAVVCGGTALWAQAPEYGHVSWEKAALHGHTPWDRNYFGVRPPPLDAAQEGVLLVNDHWGDWLDSYTALLTVFPQRMRLVKISGPLMEWSHSPGHPLQMHEDVQDLLDHSAGPFYLLSHRGGLDTARRLLAAYGLRLDDVPHVDVTDGRVDLVLFRVARMPGSGYPPSRP
jgi:hypothetical protein